MLKALRYEPDNLTPPPPPIFFYRLSQHTSFLEKTPSMCYNKKRDEPQPLPPLPPPLSDLFSGSLHNSKHFLGNIRNTMQYLIKFIKMQRGNCLRLESTI